MQLIEAIAAAMEDYLDNDGEFTPHNPAVMRDKSGYYYGSALHAETGDIVVEDLSGGFGAWTPENKRNIAAAACGYMQAIVTAGGAIKSAAEGTVHLYEFDGVDYVVLCDNTVITRDEDCAAGPDAAFFPY